MSEKARIALCQQVLGVTYNGSEIEGLIAEIAERFALGGITVDSSGVITFNQTPTYSPPLAVASGGTAIASYAVGDLLYASAAATLAKLADVATGNVLLSGGVATAPAYGKVLNAHVDDAAAIAWSKVSKTSSSLADLATRAAANLSDGANVALLNGSAFTGAVSNTSTIALAATQKLYLDGVAATGDTYIQESAANTLSLFSGGVEAKLVSGVFTASGFGTHSLSAGGTGAQIFKAANTAAGTSNQSVIQAASDTVTVSLASTSSNFTTGTYAAQAGSYLATDGAGGLSIAATHASGAIRLYSGGTTARVTIAAAGAVTLSAHVSGTPSFVGGDKYLVVDGSGNIHVSALGPAS